MFWLVNTAGTWLEIRLRLNDATRRWLSVIDTTRHFVSLSPHLLSLKRELQFYNRSAWSRQAFLLDLHIYRPQRSCVKVIFLHLSVILFTGGCAWQGACMTGRVWQGVCVAGGMCARGHVWQWGAFHARPPPDTTRYGQWAGGTHPTGMHTSDFCFLPWSTFKLQSDQLPVQYQYCAIQLNSSSLQSSGVFFLKSCFAMKSLSTV